MSYDEIKLDYEKAEAMAKIFAEGAERLEETMKEMQSIAQVLEGGALLGRGGGAFSEAIKDKLSPSLSRLIDKFREMNSDVNVAIAAMRRADSEAKKQFS